MSNVANVLGKFDVSIAELVKKYQAEGKKMIGVSPIHMPVEMVYASGMIPMGLWGGSGEVSAAKEYFPAFYCSIVQRVMEMSLTGQLDCLSGIMVSIQCDSLKALGQNIRRAVGDKIPYIHVAMAQNRKLECGVDFNETQYRKVKNQLEEIKGDFFSDEDIEKAIKLYNKSKKLMQEFVAVAADYPQIITPSKRSQVLTIANYMDRAEYVELLEELIAELKKEEVKPWDGKKIVTTGIMTSLPSLNEILEENKLAIVEDEVAEESRQFRTLVDEDTDNPIRALAKYLGDIEGCSVMYDADIFKADASGGQNSGQRGDAACFVHHVAVKGVYFFQWTCRSIGNGIPVIPGGGKEAVNSLGILFFQLPVERLQLSLVMLQRFQNV